MTDKEILERAGRIMQSQDRPHIAAALEHAAEHLEPSDFVNVRMAVVVNVHGWAWAVNCHENTSDRAALEVARENCSPKDTAAYGIVSFRIPLRKIPAVTGTVEVIDDPEATI